MSSQLKKEKEQPVKREEKADFLFNQHIVRTVAYTAAGFGFGMIASLLFKHKAGMTLFFAGTGAGYGGANFVNDLSVFRRNRNWAGPSQIQSQGQDQRDQRRFDRSDATQIKENVKEGAEDVSKFMANKVNQAARGMDEAGRKVTEKAKEFARGGDDDSSDKNRREEDRSRKQDDSKNKQSQTQGKSQAQPTNLTQGQRKEESGSKTEQKGTFPPGKGEKEKAGTVNVKGQTLQSFESNPNKAGPVSETHHATTDYQMNRNNVKDPKEQEKTRQVGSLAQERGGVDSIKKAENIRLPSDPFSRDYGKKVDTQASLPTNQMHTSG